MGATNTSPGCLETTPAIASSTNGWTPLMTLPQVWCPGHGQELNAADVGILRTLAMTFSYCSSHQSSAVCSQLTALQMTRSGCRHYVQPVESVELLAVITETHAGGLAVSAPWSWRRVCSLAGMTKTHASLIVLMGITAGVGPAHAQSVEVSSTRWLYEQGHRWLVGVGVGSGGGYVVAPDGFGSSAGVHVTPEIGIFVLPRVSLSAQLREDIAFRGGWNWRHDLTNGLALLGRGTLWLGEGPMNLKLSVFGGNGNYFHRLRGPCGPSGDTCTAIKTSGDKVAGVGVGLSYLVTRRVALTAGLDLVGGVPNRMVHADVNVGVTTRF